MNYNHFLNKSNKFKNTNYYRLERKKKNRKGFLLFSAVSAAVLTLMLTLFIDTEKTVIQAFEQAANTLVSPSETISVTSDEQNIALDLPEITYHSETLSNSIIYSEPELKVSEPSSAEQKLSEKVLAHANLAEEITVNNSPEKIETTVKNIDMVKVAPAAITEQKDLNNQPASQNISTAALNKKDTLEGLKNQALSTLAQAQTERSKTVVVKSGDTLSAIFKRLSLSAGTLHKIINSSKQAKKLTRIKPGQKLIITFNESNKFKSLHYDLDRVDTLIINKEPDNTKIVTRIVSKEIDVKNQFAAGTISNSLFSSGNKAGLSGAMIMKLAQLFGWDIDFALDIRKGDSFAVLFEEKYIDDKKIGSGNILSAEFVNRGKIFKAIRYTDASGHTDYYSEKGLSMRKAFLRTPVEFSRISSRFSGSRKHPVLNRIRAHKGVDYAASRGTPIKAVGDGKVIFKGRKGGYGNVIILQHGSRYTTLYAHMKSYNRKIKKGSRVEQGQIIGYVGSSGLATGPHLHYEFRVNGMHRNPLTVPLPSASPIAKKYRSDFQNTADTMISQLKSRKLETIAFSEQ